ncbi:MAG: hypothetical protein Q8S84_02105 [bacterium]|nr:hypothetical protein [bacterium]MDP3380349.1 hypothetical protein [bacterium]
MKNKSLLLKIYGTTLLYSISQTLFLIHKSIKSSSQLIFWGVIT